jgi:hypothetical protein
VHTLLHLTPVALLGVIIVWSQLLVLGGFLLGHIDATRPVTSYDRFNLWCAVNLRQLAAWMERGSKGRPPSPPYIGPGYWY